MAMEDMALRQALEGQQGPAISNLPPELLELAAELGIDVNDPDQLMQLLTMLGQPGGGGGLGY